MIIGRANDGPFLLDRSRLGASADDSYIVVVEIAGNNAVIVDCEAVVGCGTDLHTC